MNISSILNPTHLVRRLHYKLYELRHPNEPWISQAAVRFCEQQLDSVEHIGLEWGSGRSTKWYAHHLRHLTSVEHDKKWYKQVKNQLLDSSVENVNYFFVPLDHDLKLPCVPIYENPPKYVEVASSFADQSIDFVVVDGHYRQACVIAAVPKLRSGGLLLVDNTNWLPLEQWCVPSSWKVVHQSSNVMTETTIWQKS